MRRADEPSKHDSDGGQPPVAQRSSENNAHVRRTEFRRRSSAREAPPRRLRPRKLWLLRHSTALPRDMSGPLARTSAQPRWRSITGVSQHRHSVLPPDKRTRRRDVPVKQPPKLDEVFRQQPTASFGVRDRAVARIEHQRCLRATDAATFPDAAACSQRGQARLGHTPPVREHP